MKQILLLLFLAASAGAAQTEFSQDRAYETVRMLAGKIGPRPMGSPAEQRALQYAIESFHAAGCDTSYLMQMDRTERGNTTSGIAVGILKGATGRIIVLGGHIDSAGPEIPGADDDASGIAVVVEVARALGENRRKDGQPLQSTIVFACFGGEEQGLIGSKYFVDHFDQIDSVAMMLQVDMANGLGIIDIDPHTHAASAPPWLVRAAIEEFYALGYENLRYPTHFYGVNYAGTRGSGSDHESFLARGIPAIDFSTDVSKPIHTPQDNLDNFDPRGLKRSGKLVLRLIERFDGGVPDRDLSNYWLYLVGSFPIFIPFLGIWVFVGVTVLLMIWALASVRGRRLSTEKRVRWSALKLLLFTFIVVVCAACTTEIMAIVKGVRYPWFGEIQLYYLLAILSAATGIWLCLHLTRKLPLTTDAFLYLVRSVIILLILLVLLGLASPRLAVPPAAALFLLSLAMIVRLPFLKLVLFVLSPIWLLRMVFSEWDELMFRTLALAGQSAPDLSQKLIASAIMIALLTFYIYPHVLSFAAVYRDSKSWEWIGGMKRIRTRAVGVTLALILIGWMAYLFPRPAYSREWSRTVHVEHILNSQTDTLPNSPRERIVLRSKEYLDGVRIKGSYRDTILTGHITEAKIPLRGNDDYDLRGLSSHLIINRDIRTSSGETTAYDIEYDFNCSQRPYTLSISYSSSGKEFIDFSTPWLFTTDGKRKVMRWYSFPEQILSIPVRFEVASGDSVTERMEIVFDDIMYDWKFERPMTNFIKRTRFETSRIIKP